jgi:hypothetical protein
MFLPDEAVRVVALCYPDGNGWLIQEIKERFETGMAARN